MKRGLTLIALVALLAAPAPVESQLTNISRGGFVQTGDDVVIGGFIKGRIGTWSFAGCRLAKQEFSGVKNEESDSIANSYPRFFWQGMGQF